LETLNRLLETLNPLSSRQTLCRTIKLNVDALETNAALRHDLRSVVFLVSFEDIRVPFNVTGKQQGPVASLMSGQESDCCLSDAPTRPV